MRYFGGTSGTSNTANSSDARKTSASVTRLSSYFINLAYSEMRVGYRIQITLTKISGWLQMIVLKKGRGKNIFVIYLKGKHCGEDK